MAGGQWEWPRCTWGCVGEGGNRRGKERWGNGKVGKERWG